MTIRSAVPPDFDSQHFRQALGRFATGVTVITARNVLSGRENDTERGAFVGVTVSSFNSVSLTPPLVLWSLGMHTNSLPLFRASSHYVINVLGADQLALCRRFANGHSDRFVGVDYRLGNSGLPILSGALAWFECHNRSRYEEGDHMIFVGEVERCGFIGGLAGAALAPLIFHDGRFATPHALNRGIQD